MIELAVGDKFNNQFLDTLISWNEEFYGRVRVTELYGSVKGFATARSQDRLPKMTRQEIEVYVRKALEARIEHKWTLNQSCIGSLGDFHNEYARLTDLVAFLRDIGVKKFIVTVPLIAEAILNRFPGAILEVSTIARIRTTAEIAYWHHLGAKSMCGELDLNRCYRDVKALNTFCKKLGMTYWVLANEFCIRGCIHRPVCYNLSSHDSTRVLYGAYPFGRCDTIRKYSPEEWIKASTIIPQFMNKYYDLTGVNRFKITGRTAPAEVLLPIIRAYMEEDYNGNLINLWAWITHLSLSKGYITKIPMSMVSEFIMTNNWQSCGVHCGACDKCKKVYESIKHKLEG